MISLFGVTQRRDLMANYNLPACSDYFKGELYRQMHDDLHLAGMAQRTIHGYLRSVRQLADFCQRPPDQISEQQVRQWLIHLKVDCQFAYGSLRVAFSGIKFFYTRSCRRDWKVLSETKLQNVKALPEVLTRDQVHAIIDACRSLRMATFFWTVYSLGLRLEEGLNLHVGDIDSQRMMVHIHRGKGAKDRYVPLPISTLQ
jgi:site-specific recombinase XerD